LLANCGLFSGRALRVKTFAGSNNDTLWNKDMSTNYKVFEVQTCQEALVTLTPRFNDKGQGYRINIGAAHNSLTTVDRLPSGGHHTVHTPNIVNCDQLTSFWVRYTFLFIY
jgi:hypothetical protein